MIGRMTPGVLPSPTTPRQALADVESEPKRGALRVARGLLLLLALLLPFETPLFRLGPLRITTVELALYLLLAAWAVVVTLGVAVSRSPVRCAVDALRGDAAAQAALLWCVVVFVSAAVAPSDRAAVLKFALRTLSGVLVFFATRSLTRPPDVARRVLLALVAGALLSAATALVDALSPGSAPLWAIFRQGDFETFGLARASGVFAYPTIGAMYWEAAVPLVVVAPFLESAAHYRKAGSTGGVAFAILGGVLLVGAILASATRAGLAGAVIACAAMAGLTWRSGPSLRRATTGVLVVSSVLTLNIVLSGSRLGQRLQWWRDATWFGVEYLAKRAPPVVRVREDFSVPVTLRNSGNVSWPHAGIHPTRLAYHWERLDGPTTRADFEGQRTALPADVPPSGAIELVAIGRGPDIEGAYLLRWDLVQEDVTWFSERGNGTPEQRVDVIPAWEVAPPSAESQDAAALVLGPPAAVAPEPLARVALWRAALVLWRERPLLGIGPDNFRRRYPAVLSAGSGERGSFTDRLHANSLYFETLADLGLAGVFALVMLVIALARLIRDDCRSAYGPKPNLRRPAILGLGCGVATGSFFVHGLFDYFFEFTPLFGLFWVLLGLTVASRPQAA
jgi:hypothetical protein